MERLFLGTHEPTWIGRSDAPLFVSLERRDRFGRRAARGGWALDSGGFTRLHQGGWTTEPKEYLDQVYQLADRCPGMMWAAPQDWMCEPSAIKATGLSVIEHQRRTVDNYVALAEMDERGLVIPVLQGYAPGDHERCVALYEQAGIDVRAEPVVGVGTICRRQATDEIHSIIKALHDEGVSMHGFGVKIGGLSKYGPLLTSADSMAWSLAARWHTNHGHGALGSTCTHRCCNNCFVWAHEWWESLVRRN